MSRRTVVAALAGVAFRLVLTPKNDPISHKDHVHIDANPRYATQVSLR